MNKCKWTHDDIRHARKAELIPLLTHIGYRLQPVNNGNYEVIASPPACPEPCRGVGLVVKQHFWLWPDHHLAGNTIDFFIKIEGKTFQEAMTLITCRKEIQ